LIPSSLLCPPLVCRSCLPKTLTFPCCVTVLISVWRPSDARCRSVCALKMYVSVLFCVEVLGADIYVAPLPNERDGVIIGRPCIVACAVIGAFLCPAVSVVKLFVIAHQNCLSSRLSVQDHSEPIQASTINRTATEAGVPRAEATCDSGNCKSKRDTAADHLQT